VPLAFKEEHSSLQRARRANIRNYLQQIKSKLGKREVLEMQIWPIRSKPEKQSDRDAGGADPATLSNKHRQFASENDFKETMGKIPNYQKEWQERMVMSHPQLNLVQQCKLLESIAPVFIQPQKWEYVECLTRHYKETLGCLFWKHPTTGTKRNITRLTLNLDLGYRVNGELRP